MEFLIGIIESLAQAIGHIAWASAACYIVGIVSKTILVINMDAEPEELKDWTEIGSFFRRKKNKNNIL